MEKIYSSENPIMAGHVKSLLENSGIACLIKNQNLSSGMGELPPIECWPEVWIINDADHEAATEIVNAMMTDDQPTDSWWTCVCGETIEGQFSTCWLCGTDRPDK